MLEGSEFEERAFGREAGLLRELAPRRRQRVFAGIDEALGDSPGPVVLVLSERSTRMDEQELDLPAVPAIEQDACALLGHDLRS